MDTLLSPGFPVSGLSLSLKFAYQKASPENYSCSLGLWVNIVLHNMPFSHLLFGLLSLNVTALPPTI